MYDLIIVGGGPAGLTAAIYAIRKRLDVFLVSQDLGGKTNYSLELPDMEMHQVIRGTEVVERFWRELDYLDFARHLERVTAVEKHGDVFTVTTAGGYKLQGQSVILATGSRIKQLGVPGERDFIGRGLGYSATSYAPLFVGKCVAVIGDGALALRSVAELALVADTVHLVVPVPTYDVLETPLLRKLATNLKVVIWEGYRVAAIAGNGFANRLILATPEGREFQVEADGIFIELGLLPNSEPVTGLAEVDSEGRVMIDTLNRTSCPGLFAAGDVTNAYAEQVLIAIGEGAKAALSAYDYLLPML
jgi:alkyl hydroperoxide reductase subunit F